MIDTASLSANELVSKLKSGDISSVELCKAYIKRIEKFDKEVQAWAFLDKKVLLEKAEEADEYRKSGKPLGALHGLPVAVKDIIGTYDMPTECGTVFRKKMSSSQDSEIVNLLKNAGAIIMGKTVTCELATFIQVKQKILMIIQEHPEVPLADQLQLWPLIWHIYQLALRLVDQLLDRLLTAVLWDINHLTD